MTSRPLSLLGWITPKHRTLTSDEMTCLRELEASGGFVWDDSQFHERWKKVLAGLAPAYVSPGNFWAPGWQITRKGRRMAAVPDA